MRSSFLLLLLGTLLVACSTTTPSPSPTVAPSTGPSGSGGPSGSPPPRIAYRLRIFNQTTTMAIVGAVPVRPCSFMNAPAIMLPTNAEPPRMPGWATVALPAIDAPAGYRGTVSVIVRADGTEVLYEDLTGRLGDCGGSLPIEPAPSRSPALPSPSA